MSFEGWDPLLKIVISTYLIEQDLSPTTLLKETPTHVFFCKHWEVFKNTFLKRIFERLLALWILESF